MKRLLALFIVLVCINGTTFSQKKAAGQVKTVVIDAGHGGDKPGAIGKKSKEKNITLSLALKLGKLIEDNYPDVRIIYTRTTDVDITLAERARIANRAKADLFLSIHCNSWTNSTPTGVETYVMGLSQSRANMEVAKKENADILLEKDYKDNSDYQGFDPNSPESYVMFAMYQNAYIDKSLDFAGLIQDQYKSAIKTINRGVKQAEIFVLYKTAMPAVLTEVGFISNPEEEQYMMSDEGQATIVVSIFKAFVAYKSQTEGVKPPSELKIELKGYKAPAKRQKADEVATPQPTPTAAEASKPGTTEAVAKTEPPMPSTMIPSTAQTHVEPPLPIDEPKPKTTAPQPKAESKNTATAAPAVTPAATPTATEPAPTPAQAKGEVVYKVQFMTSTKELKPNAREFKGIKDYESYRQRNIICYTTGRFATVREASEHQKAVREKGFSDAFVVAFQGSERITMQQAKELSGKQ